MKTTWKIINREKGTNQQDISVPTLTIDDSTIANQSIIANTFNNYFSSVTDSITLDKKRQTPTGLIRSIIYIISTVNLFIK